MFHYCNLLQIPVSAVARLNCALLPAPTVLLVNQLHGLSTVYLPNIRNTDILTYICRSFGYREVGAHTPGSSVVVLLTAAAVGPCGVVFTLTA